MQTEQINIPKVEPYLSDWSPDPGTSDSQDLSVRFVVIWKLGFGICDDDL